MSARVDLDEDSGGKAMTTKETRLILAVNSSESTLIDAMTKAMLDVGSQFDVDVFIDVFRKYTHHFVEMLSPSISIDSDDEDELPLPNKFLPFLTSFAKSKDRFVAAIEDNYKALFKKDLKQINFAVVKSYPEELFKCYENLNGRERQPTSTSLSNACQPSNPVLNIEEKMPFPGILDDSLNRMNINDVSVDTDHASIMSAHEEELRKIAESESDTPTPTLEDWNGIHERRVERSNEHNKQGECLSDGTLIMVPPMGQIPDLPMQHSHGSPLVVPIPTNAGREVESVKGREKTNEEEQREHGMMSQVTDFEEQIMAMTNELAGAMREVHQDIRFALPKMMERAVSAYVKEKRSLTLTEFIGEQYVDSALEGLLRRLIQSDSSLKRMIELELRPEEGTLVRLRQARAVDKKSLPLTPTTLLPSVEYVDFFPELPLHLQDAANDVTLHHTGVLAITLSKLTPLVESQLQNLRHLNTDHLNLSNERQLEEGRAVVLKNDMGTYCRGVIREKWIRNSDGTGSPVKCTLIDFGEDYEIPIAVMYAFPKWTETIHPAIVQLAKPHVYPKGATKKTDQFSQSDWDLILRHLNEWKNNGRTYLDIDVVRREGDVLLIDLKNGQGHSFNSFLVESGLAQLELTPSRSSTTFATPSHDEPLPSESSLESENTVQTTLSPSMLPSLENSGDTQTHKLVNSIPSMGIPPIAVPAFFGAVSKSEARREGWMNTVKGIDSCPTVPSSMHVPSEDGSKLDAIPSLIVRKEEPKRTFLEIPKSAGIPSILQIVAQPPLPELPPILLTQPRKCFVQVMDDDE